MKSKKEISPLRRTVGGLVLGFLIGFILSGVWFSAVVDEEAFLLEASRATSAHVIPGKRVSYHRVGKSAVKNGDSRRRGGVL